MGAVHQHRPNGQGDPETASLVKWNLRSVLLIFFVVPLYFVLLNTPYMISHYPLIPGAAIYQEIDYDSLPRRVLHVTIYTKSGRVAA